jgi:pimeloyl-ACP methyl ester carboxylesterase
MATLTVDSADTAGAVQNSSSSLPTIVLVHGAWADGSSWQHVIPLLVRDGFRVIATANPLGGLDGDVATTKRVIDAEQRPMVVVGHSYGGAVITGAAAGNPNVKALVYLAAFAPDVGEGLGAVASKYPPTPTVKALLPDSAGFLSIDRAKFHDAFCKDVPDDEALLMNITQRPLSSGVFTQTLTAAAWKTIPSWYVVSKNDRAIDPNQERFYASRMKAHTTEIDSSHVVMISHPKEVTAIIEEAAHTTAAAGGVSQAVAR